MVIEASHLFPVDGFSFEAVCRWVKRRRSEGVVDAGIEITDISEEGKKQLQKIIRFLNLQELVFEACVEPELVRLWMQDNPIPHLSVARWNLHPALQRTCQDSFVQY